MSKVRPAGQIRPSVNFYPARSLVMKYITLVYCYLASSINILHLPTRDQQHNERYRTFGKFVKDDVNV